MEMVQEHLLLVAMMVIVFTVLVSVPVWCRSSTLILNKNKKYSNELAEYFLRKILETKYQRSLIPFLKRINT